MSAPPSPASAGRRLVPVPVVGCLLALATACAGPSADPVAGPAPATTSAPQAPSAPGESPDPQAGTSSPSTEATRFAVVGDSLTAGDVPTDGRSAPGRGSWVPVAEQYPGLEFTGGWAAPGATTATMLQGITPLDADVLVVMAGTNDLGSDLPWPVTASNLQQLVAIAGVPTVLLSAVPPRTDRAAEAQELNARLAQLAAGQGWTFVDPWADMDADGAWVPGASDDGIHPTEPVATLVGERLAAAIAAAG